MLTRLTGEGVQANKAVVGRNAFAHEAGIHQDGMLKDRRTYEIMRAEDVGAPWNPLVLGKHSGRHAVQRRCSDLGLRSKAGELVEVYRALMAIADERKVMTDSDIVAVVSSVEHRRQWRHEPVDPFDTPSGRGRRASPEPVTATAYRLVNPKSKFKLQIPNDSGNAHVLGFGISNYSVLGFSSGHMIIRPVGGAMPRSANIFAIRFRSSRPTSHCFSGTVLMRAFSTSCVVLERVDAVDLERREDVGLELRVGFERRRRVAHRRIDALGIFVVAHAERNHVVGENPSTCSPASSPRRWGRRERCLPRRAARSCAG